MKLLKNIFFALLWIGSAVVIGIITNVYKLGIPTDQSFLALGSAFFFAVATLGRLGTLDQTWDGKSDAECSDALIFYLMYWIGMYLATVSII